MSVLEYKCPSCSAGIKFNSEHQSMKCESCGSEFDVDAIQAIATSQQAQEARDDTHWDSNSKSSNGWSDAEKDMVKAYVCGSCGGEIVTASTTSATKCPFCESPVILSNNLDNKFKPDMIIPFKLDKQSAMQAFRNNLKNKVLLPSKFKSEAHLHEIKGMYVPYWLFDCRSNGHIFFKGVRSRSWKSGQYMYTEKKYYSVERGVEVGFRMVPADASIKMPDDLMESIEPYDYRHCTGFSTAYLSGYLADKYDVSTEQCEQGVNERIKATTLALARETVQNYNTVTLERQNYVFDNKNVSYALMPVWLMNARWNGKDYIFAMNGQSGKIAGKLPASKLKAFLAGVATYIVSILILTIITHLAI